MMFNTATRKLPILTEEEKTINPTAKKMFEISEHPSVTTGHLNSLNSSTKRLEIADSIRKTRSRCFLLGTRRQSRRMENNQPSEEKLKTSRQSDSET